jgi:AI-2 transport protein TqsA
LLRPSLFKPLIIFAAVVIIVYGMRLAASMVTPILMGLFIAAIVSPIYGWLKKRTSSALSLLLTCAFLLLVVLFLVLLVGNSLTALTTGLADYSGKFSQRLAELQAATGTMSQSAVIQAVYSVIDPGTLAKVLGYFLGNMLAMVKDGVLVLFVTLFILAESSKFKEGLSKTFGPEHVIVRKTLVILGLTINYFGLRAIVNLVVAAITALMLWALGIPYAGLWFVLIFFMSFVPYIGAIISMIPPAILAYAQGGLGLAIVVIVLAVIINSLNENITQPMLMGKSLSISPTIVFLSVIFWVFILGGTGAFIALPLTMAMILVMGSFEETYQMADLMATIPEPGK